MENQNIKILLGDCTESLKTIDDGVIQTCVTSPPYFGLRDYGVEGQIGLEEKPLDYVNKLTEVFREVKRVLREDGTVWLNIGDSYSAACSGNKSAGVVGGLKPKDLIGIPWRVAFALQADGWYLRQDIIWHKTNPMPESVKDRCTKSHEYIFLLSKSPRYYYDQEAILEPCSPNTHARLSQNVQAQVGSARANGGRKTNGNMKAVGRKYDPGVIRNKNNPSFDAAMSIMPQKRNKRSVWTVSTKPYKGAHFATFPVDLIEPCVLAGSKSGDLVLDPFAGSGTVGQAALKHGRRSILCELNMEYIPLMYKRLGFRN